MNAPHNSAEQTRRRHRKLDRLSWLAMLLFAATLVPWVIYPEMIDFWIMFLGHP
jgi:hypothetical protein